MSQSSLKVRVSTASCFQRTSADIAFDSFGENLLKLFLQLGNIGRDELPTENTSSINCVGNISPEGRRQLASLGKCGKIVDLLKGSRRVSRNDKQFWL